MTQQVFKSDYQWNLYSSSGRASVGGNFLKTWRNSEGQELILTEIAIVSSWIDRTADKISFSNLKGDFSVVLSQVIVERLRLELFLSKLADCFDLPAEHSIQLHPNAKDQTFAFSLRVPNFSNSLGKMEFCIAYSGIDFIEGKWYFLIDHSCVKIFINEINCSFDTLGRAA